MSAAGSCEEVTDSGEQGLEGLASEQKLNNWTTSTLEYEVGKIVDYSEGRLDAGKVFRTVRKTELDE